MACDRSAAQRAAKGVQGNVHAPRVWKGGQKRRLYREAAFPVSHGEMSLFFLHASAIDEHRRYPLVKRRFVSFTLLVVLFTLLLTGCGTPAPKVDWEVSITGAVSNPLTLSYKDLTKRDQVTLKDVLMQKSHGEDQVNTWEGPALAPILEEAGASPKATGLICAASDGYAKDIPMADLTDAIIALKMDGKWIAGDEKGPIRLVVPSKPSDRWIFQLASITVGE